MLSRRERNKIKATAEPTRQTFIAKFGRVPALDIAGSSPDWREVPWEANAQAICKALEGFGSTGPERWQEYKRLVQLPLEVA